MIVTHKIRMDLAKREGIPRIDTAQEDKLSRVLEFGLYTGEEEWPVPEGSTAVVRFTKPDGTGGSYDTLPDGTAACTISGSTVTVLLAPQVCTAPGLVQLAVCLIRGEAELHTFGAGIHVHGTPGMEETSDGYYRVTGSLAASGWPPNMALGTDEKGSVVASMGAAGASPALRSAIYNLLMDAAYQSADHGADRAALEELLAGGSGDSVSYIIEKALTNVTISNHAASVAGGASYRAVLTAEEGYALSEVVVTMGGEAVAAEGGVIEIAAVTGNIVITAIAAAKEEAVTLTGISAAYSGGDVAAGTAVTDLTGIAVTAHYSDGSSGEVTGYTLSGTIAEGSNTVTVSYQGMTTTFTVNGVASAPETNGWEDGVPYELAAAEAGKYIKTGDGSIGTDANYSVTDYLPCQGAATISLDASVSWGSYNAFYDADRAFIKAFTLNTNGASVNVPENAHYLRLSGRTANFTAAIFTPHA